MRKVLVLLILVLTLLAGGVLWRLRAAATPPTVSAPTAVPNLITINTPTPVLFTVSIPDANVQGVNLLRVNANGSSNVVAQMVDNGTNGDAVSGDKVFTARLVLTESVPATFGFRVSVAFRGIITRSLSPTLQYPALAPVSIPVVLPPDPGEAGKATLAGIDSDRDGVRDDVQRYIIFTYPQSEKLRTGLSSFAKTFHSYMLTTAGDAQAAYQRALINNAARYCLYSFMGFDNGRLIVLSLEAFISNTRSRTLAVSNTDKLLSGKGFDLPSSNWKTFCTVDMSGMEN